MSHKNQKYVQIYFNYFIFSLKWAKFCKGQLGKNSKQQCYKCGQPLCRQSDVIVPTKRVPEIHYIDGGNRRLDTEMPDYQGVPDYQKALKEYGLKNAGNEPKQVAQPEFWIKNR